MGKQWAQYSDMSGMTDGKTVGSNGSEWAQNTKGKAGEGRVVCVFGQKETAGRPQGDKNARKQKKENEAGLRKEPGLRNVLKKKCV